MFNRCLADRPAPTSIKRVCVFCGARRGRNPLFTQVASELGRELARAGLGIVYGGGGSGLMGAVARAALQSGGAVTGVMPHFLAEHEEALLDNHEFILVDDMGARKSEMAARADAFITLPGGLGTLEEIAEQMTWAKLGRHTKPMVLLDAANYWRHLTGLLDHMCAEGFTSAEDFERLFIAPDVPTAISRVIGLGPPNRFDIVSDQRCAQPLLNEISTGEALHEVYLAPAAEMEGRKSAIA
jgi:uncharacterized protein (TIGR00730 family)